MSTEANKNQQLRSAQPTLSDREKYFQGPGLDIGFAGYVNGSEPVYPDAVGIDVNYPGYDGRTLPFPDRSQGYVHSSHCLEHISDYRQALREWYRVLRVGGYMIVTVPHKFLYEKRKALPSRWNKDHKRFYTPSSLLSEVEEALEPNTYRVIRLKDNDYGFNYARGPLDHSSGCYEIELILQRIVPPSWELED